MTATRSAQHVSLAAFQDRLRGAMREAQFTDLPFPPDEEVTRIMKRKRRAALARIPDEQCRRHFEAATEITQLRLPAAFRTGPLSRYFAVNNDPETRVAADSELTDASGELTRAGRSRELIAAQDWCKKRSAWKNCGGWTCQFHPWFHSNNEDDSMAMVEQESEEMRGELTESGALSYIDQRCSTPGCSVAAEFHAGDLFYGFGMIFDRRTSDEWALCGGCHEKQHGDTLKCELLRVLAQVMPSGTRSVNRVIQDYARPVMSLARRGEARIATHVFDWVAFLYCWLEESTSFYLVNCNPDSKYYGHVVWANVQHEFELWGPIDDFCQPDFMIARLL